MVIMLCNQPFTLAKFISCSETYDIKNIRSFFGCVFQQKNVFKPLCALELGRRIFLILLEAQTNKSPI